MNAKTGKILYEKNAFIQAYPASTTKIATALYALHLSKGDIDQKFLAKKEALVSITPLAKKQSNYRSPSHWLETDGTHVSIKVGEEMPLRELFYAMLISSANDASNTIAQNLAGTIPNFVEGMNVYLKEIGCLNTHFNNPHGLHHPKHMTTPYDLATIARIAMQNDFFRSIVSCSRHVIPKTNLEYERTCIQTNMLLRQGAYFYPKAIGIKTGTTQIAGKNLVAAAIDQGRELIAVLMGYRGSRDELYSDAIRLFESAFTEPQFRRVLLKKGELVSTKVLLNAKKPLKVYLSCDLDYDFYPSEDEIVKMKFSWNIPTLPIIANTQVGEVSIINSAEEKLQTLPLFALENVSPKFWWKVCSSFKNSNLSQVFLGMICLFILIYVYRLFKPKHRTKRI